MKKEQKFNMHMNKVEKAQFKEFAKTHGHSSIAKLIRASLDVVRRNPSLLQPTEDTAPKELLKDLEKSFSVFGDLKASLDTIQTKLDQQERFQEWTVKKLGGKRKDIRRIKGKDLSSEAVFE